MKEEIKVPPMGESITEATVSQILKESGSVVEMDEEVIELETDKVNQVLFAPKAGVLTLHVSKDDVVKIGDVIGFVQEGGEEKKEPPKKEVQEPPKKEEKKIEAKPAGKIREDKDAFLQKLMEKPKVEKSKQAAERETRTKMSKIRKVIATRLLEATKNTAMLTTFNEIDLSRVLELRERYRDLFEKEHGVKLGFMSFFVKAAVAALQAVPLVNGYIDGDEIVQRNYYDIGIAVGTQKGLVVPVIRDCDHLTFAQIENQIFQFAEKARKGGLSVDDLKGGGFTITNGGVYGSLLSTPILNPPQSAILGMHKIEKRAVVVDDQIVIRPMMYVALSYDHRIIDGKEAVTFLVDIKNCLEEPSRILLGV
jgi:2-oxoglutarate dehydrogenase E2 component (dihydrolipoamide succinyltransferase)